MYYIPCFAHVGGQVTIARCVNVIDVDLSNHHGHLVDQLNTLQAVHMRKWLMTIIFNIARSIDWWEYYTYFGFECSKSQVLTILS